MSGDEEFVEELTMSEQAMGVAGEADVGKKGGDSRSKEKRETGGSTGRVCIMGSRGYGE